MHPLRSRTCSRQVTPHCTLTLSRVRSWNKIKTRAINAFAWICFPCLQKIAAHHTRLFAIQRSAVPSPKREAWEDHPARGLATRCEPPSPVEVEEKEISLLPLLSAAKTKNKYSGSSRTTSPRLYIFPSFINPVHARKPKEHTLSGRAAFCRHRRHLRHSARFPPRVLAFVLAIFLDPRSRPRHPIPSHPAIPSSLSIDSTSLLGVVLVLLLRLVLRLLLGLVHRRLEPGVVGVQVRDLSPTGRREWGG